MSVSSQTLSTISSGVKSFSAFSAARYSSKINKMNAALAEQNAKYSRAKGELEAQRLHRLGLEVAGSQRAAFGASGASVGSGSPVDVIADTFTRSDIDASMARYNAELEAFGFEVEASNYKAAAQADSMVASQNLLGLGSTLLTSVTSLQKKYL